jgi:hypothetical protein
VFPTEKSRPGSFSSQDLAMEQLNNKILVNKRVKEHVPNNDRLQPPGPINGIQE